MRKHERKEIFGLKLNFYEFDDRQKDVDIEIPKEYRFSGVDLEEKKVIVSFKLKK